MNNRREEELQFFNAKYDAHAEAIGSIDISGESLNDYFDKEGAYYGINLKDAPTEEYLKVIVIKHSEDWFVQQALTAEQVMWLRAKRGKGTEKDISEWKIVDFGDGTEQGRVEITIVEKPIDHPIASINGHGYMSKTDKKKLDSIQDSANNYTHPEKHSPSIIAQDELNLFVTEEEKRGWTNKASKYHDHDDSYAPLNHDHKRYEDQISELARSVLSLVDLTRSLTEQIEDIAIGSIREKIQFIENEVNTLKNKVNEHTEEI